MVSLVAILIWRLPAYVVFPVFLIFAALDGVFLTSVFTKVPEGAWFTLLLAIILSSIFILWRFGKEAQWAAESLDRLPPSHLLSLENPANPRLAPAFGGASVSTVEGLGIFFDKMGDPAVLPASFAHFVRKFAARPTVLVFFHMRPLPLPSIPLAERYVVTRTPGGMTNCYSVVLRHGYVDDVIRPGMARELVAQVELAVTQTAAPGERDTLRTACDSQTVYVLGKEAMRIKMGRGPWYWVRRMFLGVFLWIRENSRAKLADLDIDIDKLVEVGFLKEI